MRNYCGLVLSNKQYVSLGTSIENKNVFNYGRDTEFIKEKLWFALGYESSFLLVVDRGLECVAHAIGSGLLYDCQNIDMDTWDASTFYDFAQNIIYGNVERIRICNMVRDTLSLLPMHRWCSAELESVFHPNIWKNASEICGIAPLGLHIGWDGKTAGTFPSVMTNDVSATFIKEAIKIPDLGIRKLFSISLPIFIPGADIIYIGSAPGVGWFAAMKVTGFQGRILSFDPRPLDEDIMSPQINHKLLKITSFDDLLPELDEIKKYIFVWDVRNDMPQDCAERERLLTSEIAILTRILMHETFPKRVFLVQIKVNLHALSLYTLPECGLFYPQPYTLSRDVLETRFIAYIPDYEVNILCLAPDSVSNFSQTMYALKEKYTSGTLTDTDLFVNFLTTRYRRCDYIVEKPIISCLHEIVLFSINCNTPEKVIRYLEALKSRVTHFLISFFTGAALTKNEYPFPEGELCRRVDEWSVGTLAGERVYSKLTGNDPNSHSETVHTILSDCITREHVGEEIKRFLESNYGTLTPLKRLPSRGSRRDQVEWPLNPSPVEAAARIYDKERSRNASTDWCRYFLQNNSGHDVWRTGIAVLQADNVSRDTIVHQEYVNALDANFSDHDSSKHTLLETLLACLRLREPETDAGMYSLLHYWKNKHHPEYSIIHKAFTRLEVDTLNFMEILSLMKDMHQSLLLITELEPEEDQIV
ncbi:unnamed protein product [Parnassius apollo]|uniref:(apollo) hypothetical protein n=1 Tax=Parnassius apollo TaxID=110799 RepID=A0A8S3XR59_PARAO|nr:unnamed protein product [Parnassius apollo]